MSTPTCPHDPCEFAGQPIGMYHCPECGEMVLAGMPHPDYSLLEEEASLKEELDKVYGTKEDIEKENWNRMDAHRNDKKGGGEG